MGYYVTLEESTTYLPLENLDEAYQRLQELNNQDNLKHGGSFGGPNGGQRWFSWMNGRYSDGECVDAQDIIQELGFETTYDSEANLLIGYYDSKIGQEDLFFATIADLMAPGYIEWLGEDGARWRWVFDGKTMTTRHATVSWA